MKPSLEILMLEIISMVTMTDAQGDGWSVLLARSDYHV